MSTQDRPYHAALTPALVSMMRGEVPASQRLPAQPVAIDRDAVQAQALAEFRQERVATAHQAAAVLSAAIQRANTGADPLLSLLLLPLIGDAAKLETALAQIALALESRE